MRLGLRSMLALAAGLVVLLVSLAILQYRWISEISRADEQRMRASLADSADRFVEDVDREVSRAHRIFRPSGFLSANSDDSVEARWERWRTTSPHPSMILDVYRWTRQPRGARAGSLERIDPATGSVVECSWPPELEPLRSRLVEGAPILNRVGPLIPEIPALVMPGSRRFRGPAAEGGPNEPLDFLVIVFDRGWIAHNLLPDLERRYFEHGGAEDLRIEVTSIPTGELIYASSSSPRIAQKPDLTRDFFTVRDFPELRGLGPEPAGAFRGLRGGQAMDGRGAARRFRPEPTQRPPGQSPPFAPPAWRLAVSHREGTLGEAVAATRRRNLALSLGILVLLGASIVVMMIALRRENRLAHQQMEFVAGVTHELNTPLAAIRAAGQNLADGIVQGDEQARKYGSMIASDARRLADLVDDVLAFAGLSANRKSAEMRVVDLGAVIEDAVRDQEASAAAAGTSIQTTVPTGFASVRGDADSLRRALGNLIGNAIKYGGSHGPVEIHAEADARQARITIRDSGPGIPRSEIPHIFEPFWRGSDATAQQIRGSGLGLSIVKHILDAHGATIAVHSTLERGTVFVVTMRKIEDDR